MASHFAPMASNTRPVTGDIRPITAAPGSRTRPDSMAEKSFMFCMYSGRTIMPPTMTMNTHMPNRVLSVNMR